MCDSTMHNDTLPRPGTDAKKQPTAQLVLACNSHRDMHVLVFCFKVSHTTNVTHLGKRLCTPSFKIAS
jgi:hypothetical protein